MDATVNKLIREMAQLAARQHGEFLAHTSGDITAEEWLATAADTGGQFTWWR